MTHCLLYVPTNRECEDAIRAYSAEAEYLDGISPSAAFALIESNEAPHTIQHAQLFAELNRERHVPLIHLDLPLQRRLIAEILKRAALPEGEREWAQERLLPLGTSYGAGPNKAALLACALGATSLHRRDSDTTPQLYGGLPLYPAEIEGRLLGRPVNQIRELIETLDFSDERVWCVGTDYEGAAALDRLEFCELSPDLLIEHERLENPDESTDGLRARVDRKFLRRDQTAYSCDAIELDTTGRAEMGACSMAEVFRHLPEMPLGDTLGSDYFQKNLLYRLDLPVVFHNRRVRHSHAGVRDLKADPEFIRYSIRDARFKLLKRTWRAHNRNLMQCLNGSNTDALGDRFEADQYAASLEYAVSATSWKEQRELLDDLARLYHSAGDLADPVGEKFHRVARHLTDHGEELIRFVASGFNEYAQFVRLWRRLVEVAQNLPALDWSDGEMIRPH